MNSKINNFISSFSNSSTAEKQNKNILFIGNQKEIEKVVDFELFNKKLKIIKLEGNLLTNDKFF